MITKDSDIDERPALAAWYLNAYDARALCLLPLWGGVVLFILILMLRNTFYDANAAFRQSRRELVALQPPPAPDPENAARIYANATLLAYAGPKTLDPAAQPTMDGRLLDRPEIAQYLQLNAATLTALQQATSIPHCNWDLDYTKGFSLPLPHLTQFRAYARLLALEARVRAHTGDHAGAARDLRGILTLADHVEEDPLIICVLVSSAIRQIAYTTMESILWWEPPSRASDLQVYRSALSTPTHPQSQFSRAMALERMTALFTMDQIATRKVSMKALTGLPDSGITGLFVGAERDCMDRTYKDLITQPADDQDLLRLLDRNRSGTAIMASMVIPVVGRMLAVLNRTEEQRRLSTLALALLEYRLDHGEDPPGLEALVPEYLTELPLDLGAGREPHLRIDPAGIVTPNPFKPGEELPPRGAGLIRLYYLGEDGRDDGGVSTWRPEVRSGKDTPDGADDPVICVPPKDWKPEAWPTPESLGAPALPDPDPEAATPDPGMEQKP